MESYRRGLYRSSNQAIIGGVAAGIAENLRTDPTLVRIIFAIVALFGGGGLLIYLILWIALPSYETSHTDYSKDTFMNDQTEFKDQKNTEFNKHDTGQGGLIAGLIMIAIGVIFLVHRFIPRIDFMDLWPIVLLIVGVVLIKSAYTNPKS